LSVTGLLSIARVATGVNRVAVGAGTLIVGSIDFPSANTIVSGHQVTISTGALTVNGNVSGTTNKPSGSIIFSDAGTLQLGDAMFTATDGTLTTFAGSTVEYNRNGAQTIGNFSYQNLTLAGAGAKIISNSESVTVNGVLSLEGTANFPATGTLTYGAAATLQYNTTTARTAGREWVPAFVASGGVIIKNTGTITINTAKTLSVVPLPLMQALP
jgi:hypothetical protein